VKQITNQVLKKGINQPWRHLNEHVSGKVLNHMRSRVLRQVRTQVNDQITVQIYNQVSR